MKIEKKLINEAEKYLLYKQKAWNTEELTALTNYMVKNNISNFKELKNNGIVIDNNLEEQSAVFLKALAEKMNLKISEIPLDDERVISLLNNADTNGILKLQSDRAKHILNVCKPKSFEDLVKVMGFIVGTNVYNENVECKLTSGYWTLQDTPAVKEDIFSFLSSHGVDVKRCMKAMRIIGNGEHRSSGEARDFIYLLGIKHNLPPLWLDTVSEIGLMVSNILARHFAEIAFKTAYFKVYYRDTFMESHKKLYGEEETL